MDSLLYVNADNADPKAARSEEFKRIAGDMKIDVADEFNDEPTLGWASAIMVAQDKVRYSPYDVVIVDTNPPGRQAPNTSLRESVEALLESHRKHNVAAEPKVVIYHDRDFDRQQLRALELMGCVLCSKDRPLPELYSVVQQALAPKSTEREA